MSWWRTHVDFSWGVDRMAPLCAHGGAIRCQDFEDPSRNGHPTLSASEGRPRALRSFRRLLTLRGHGQRGRQVAERDPDVGIGLRLALDEAIAGLLPGQHLAFLIVEDVFAAIRLHGQHGVPVALLVANHGDQQRRARPAIGDQQLAFVDVKDACNFSILLPEWEKSKKWSDSVEFIPLRPVCDWSIEPLNN